MPGPIEIIILLAFAAVIVMGIARLFGGGSRRHGGGISFGHAMLKCPHCGQQTRADVPTCEHCHRDL